MSDYPAEPPGTLISGLPRDLAQTPLICPLCSGEAFARAVRSAHDTWEVLFICSQCGLYLPFKRDTLNLGKLRALRGSPWTSELRGFSDLERAEHRTRIPTANHIVSAFGVCMLLWLMLTGSFAPPDLLWGSIVSLSIAVFSYSFASFELRMGWMRSPRRWLALLLLTVEFMRQLFVQNITLSARVLRPRIPLRPGIVAVQTRLRGEGMLTLLGSLVSLTPDTVTVDIDEQRGILYIHWIEVTTTEPNELYRLLVRDLEDRIIDWLGDDRHVQS